MATELLASLYDEPMEGPTDIEKAWGAEIERRARRGIAGHPWEEVKLRIEARLTEG